VFFEFLRGKVLFNTKKKENSSLSRKADVRLRHSEDCRWVSWRKYDLAINANHLNNVSTEERFLEIDVVDPESIFLW